MSGSWGEVPAPPTVSVEQMREVDRLMVEELGIGLLLMMENAGRTLAEQVRRQLGGDARGRRVAVLAGRGGNGGGGLAAARRLTIWGAQVAVVQGASRERFTGVPALQLGILERMGVACLTPQAGPVHLPPADVIVDALVGYGLRGALRGAAAALVRAANEAATAIVALDVPSGLDADWGVASEPTIRATATLTLALPKAGLVLPAARAWVGELYLADISVPPEVYRRLGLDVGPIFARGDIVSVTSTRHG